MDERAQNAPQDDETISLRPYVDAVWRFRQPIAAALLIVAVVFILVAVFTVVRAPSERVASLHFRLMFAGAAQGRYPNDTPFSPMEIVGAPVLTEVYRANDLKRFLTYDDFKDSLFLQQSSPELELLSYSFQARLADTKLSAVDRANLEADFRSRRESLNDPSYALSLRRSERFSKLPRDLVEKTLTDVLALWAQQADLRKGVLKYDVPVLSSKVLSRETIQGLDYLIAADRLRAQAGRIVRTIDKLAEVPGALTIRSGAESVSLPEVRARLEDVVRFELEPLMGTIRSEGVTKNPRVLALYASNMVFQLQLEKRETEARATALQTALSDYVSQSTRSASDRPGPPTGPTRPAEAPVMPQLTESFLDRLEKMSVQAQKGEMEYRRKLTDQALQETRQAATYEKELAYYQGLEKALQGMGDRGGGSSELVNMVSNRTMKAFETIERTTNQVTAIYQELSSQNLNPAARLYEITAPYSERVQRAFSLNRLVVSFGFVMLLSLVVAIVAALLYFISRRGPATRAASPAQS